MHYGKLTDTRGASAHNKHITDCLGTVGLLTGRNRATAALQGHDDDDDDDDYSL